MLTEDLDYDRFEKRYKDKVRIGSGGFGTVYKVFDHAKNHYVALKVSNVKPEWSKFTLKNEVELVNKMERHRNIARYDACYRYNTGIAGEMDFAILKFYEDGNLEQFLLRQDLGLYDKKLIIQGILEGVQYLHRNEVIHRDLKAQNILISREDGVWCPKITDFGLSREVGNNVTITNSAVGISYAYAAPEQILNQKIYKNVDLWAVGVMIYRIISGELPFKGVDENSGSTSQSQFELSKNIVNVILPAEYHAMESPFKEMIGICLVKDPKQRVQSADKLLDILHGRVDASETDDSKPNKIKFPELHELRTPPNNVEETTQLINSAPPVHKDGYTIPEPPPISQFENSTYQQPNKNVTQVFTPDKPAIEEPEEEPKGDGMSVGERGGFNFRHLIIIVVVLLAGLAAYLWYNNLDRVVEAALPTYEGPMIPEETAMESFDELELSFADASDEIKMSKAMASIDEELATGNYENNYRLPYLKARLFAIQGQSKASFEQLELAKSMAIHTGHEEQLKADLINDEDNVFKPIKQGVPRAQRSWDQILAGL